MKRMNPTAHTVMSALAEPRRQQIVELLSSKASLNASDIAGHFEVTLAAVSQHLKVLREAKVVLMTKKAQQRLYRINPQAFEELEQWSRRMKETWTTRFDQLDALLNASD